MPFVILRNDITNMRVDAIVNTANPKPVVGLGVDSMIHQKAGPGLLRARKEIGNIACFGLSARYVIHTVGPVWEGGGQGEENLLRSCYDKALELARERHCGSIAFPLISTGNYGFPRDKALRIAISAFSEFLLKHEMQIYLVVFDSISFRLSEQLFQGVASYIDQNYVDYWQKVNCEAVEEARCRRRNEAMRETVMLRESRPAAPVQASGPASLEEMLKQADAGFTETLLKRIDQTGRKDSEIYKKALLTKQHFSKIRNNPDYRPTKPTAIALALALELDLEQTKDLIGRAGYALTNSSKFDLIIRYFIEQGNYNLVEINIALYEFDQPLLGA